MSTEGSVLVLIIGALSLVFLGYPFWRARFALNDAQLAAQRQRDTLLVSYERVLSVIRDLDDDYSAGKLLEAEYETNRSRWAERGVELLHALEAMGVSQPDGRKMRRQPAAGALANHESAAPTTAGDSEQALDDAIERAIASYSQAISGSKD